MMPCSPIVFRRKVALWIKTLAIGLVAAVPVNAWAEPSAPPELEPPRPNVTLPAAALRGYGTVSGAFARRGQGSVLVITCESEAKARLLQAKYLSDLTVLPGAKLLPGDPSLVEAEGQGVLGAWQDGAKVTILAAPSLEVLDTLKAEVKPAGVTHAQVEVPMYLDRWDKFGWRFYYRLWQAPKGTESKGYDQLKDFDDAQALDRSGFTIWDPSAQLNTTEGMRSLQDNLWLGQAADARKLPIGLNVSAEAYGFPTASLNRYPEQVQQKMPQFSGNLHKVADPYLGGRGVPSWMSPDLYDAAFATIQDSIKRFQSFASLTSVLEPHGELHHGAQDVFMEYGPLADASFREYLKSLYGSPKELGKRWLGTAGKLRSWKSVRVPEIASFLGWNDKTAVDLQGDWAVGYEDLKDPKLKLTRGQNDALYMQSIATAPAPQEWFGADFDDSAWPKVFAPGNDQLMLMQHRPAVFRRAFQMADEKLKSSPRWWLYVWDLNDAGGDRVVAWVNGKKAGESEAKRAVPHWGVFEVTQYLVPGKNQLSLRLPKGYLGYRVYLSPDEPLYYPALGAGKNAQWVDFQGWMNWTREKQLNRGMGIIREVEPNRPITLMAPDHYADTVKTIAKKFGGEFHNTGYMGVFYADYLPGLMQGAGLPFSIEPGGPARDLAEFQKMMGLYLTENVQGVDYFIHAGDILWNPEIRKNFEENLSLYHLMGKYHAPKGDVAVLFSTQSRNLTGFPWGGDLNAVHSSGYFEWNISAPLRGVFNYDDLSESSFALGDAAKYRVILDANTTILDEKLAQKIEAWIRAGGIFITSGQTGRHTPTQSNAWPINELTGFKTVRVDRYSPVGQPEAPRFLSVAPDQKVFSETWNKVRANGIALQPVASDARSLLLWDDGTTAVGMRPLGKGMIIQAGVNFGNARPPDRLEGAGIPDQLQKLRDLYSQILDFVKVPRVGAAVEPAGVYSRRYLSNNGLFDVWVLWNQNPQAASAQLNWAYPIDATTAREVPSGTVVNVEPSEAGSVLKNAVLEPMQSRGYLVPRHRIADAPLEWFELQRNWWQGSAKPSGKPLPTIASLQKWTVDLTDDWAFKPLAGDENGEALAASALDDASWERMTFMIWSAKHPEVKRALLRKTFRVPAQWKEGPIALWLQSWNRRPMFNGTANLWLDGKLLESNSQGLPGRKIKELAPGSQHTLAVEIQGETPLVGPAGQVWLSHRPRASASQDLAGEWSISTDALSYGAKVQLPGQWKGWLAKRDVQISKIRERQNVFLRYAGSADLTGLIVNGRWVRQDHHQVDKEWMINITPWVRFGESNAIQVGRLEGSGEGTVNELSLEFYDRSVYP